MGALAAQRSRQDRARAVQLPCRLRRMRACRLAWDQWRAASSCSTQSYDGQHLNPIPGRRRAKTSNVRFGSVADLISAHRVGLLIASSRPAADEKTSARLYKAAREPISLERWRTSHD